MLTWQVLPDGEWRSGPFRVVPYTEVTGGAVTDRGWRLFRGRLLLERFSSLTEAMESAETTFTAEAR